MTRAPPAVRLDRRSSEGRSCGSESMNERSESMNERSE